MRPRLLLTAWIAVALGVPASLGLASVAPPAAADLGLDAGLPAPPPREASHLLPWLLSHPFPYANVTPPWQAGSSRSPEEFANVPANLLARDWTQPPAGLVEEWRRAVDPDGTRPPAQAAPAGPVLDEFESFAALAGAPMDTDQRAHAEDAFASLAPEAQEGLARLIAGANAAARLRAQALQGLSIEERARLEEGPSPPPASAASQVDLGLLLDAADVLVASVEAALPLLENARWGPMEASAAACGVEGTTLVPPLGPCLLVVGGTAANVYRSDLPLLIDVGGDNQFFNNAGGTRLADATGVSLALNLGTSGKDIYDSTRGVAFGAAEFGVGLLLDAGGSDNYTSASGSNGYGALGVGLHVDRGGEDTYRGANFAQGYGQAGVGLLVDTGTGIERNSLTAASRAQGAGETGGTGSAHLYAAGSGGRYTLSATNTAQGVGVAGSGQLWIGGGPQATLSLTGGFGQGFGDLGGSGLLVVAGLAPADYSSLGDHSQGSARTGGMGALLDLTTQASTYIAGDYAQGTGIQYGLGFLYDAEGGDSYTAGELSQGSGVGLALGLLVDDDPSTPAVPPAPDTFTATRFGQGPGAVNGWGLLVDYLGADTYSAASQSASCCLQGVGEFLGLGLLYDLDGSDRYVGGTSSQGSYYSAAELTRYLPPETVSSLAPETVQHGGIGILWDAHGDRDTYIAISQSQGYSTARGYGILLDGGGLYDSMKSNDGATSQGCGQGGGTGIFQALGFQNDITHAIGQGVWLCDPGNPASGGGIMPGETLCWTDRSFNLHVNPQCYA